MVRVLPLSEVLVPPHAHSPPCPLSPMPTLPHTPSLCLSYSQGVARNLSTFTVALTAWLTVAPIATQWNLDMIVER